MVRFGKARKALARQARMGPGVSRGRFIHSISVGCVIDRNRRSALMMKSRHVWRLDMSSEFCYLTDSNTQKDVAVNPQQVRFVSEYRPGISLVIFDSEHILTVVGSVLEVSQQLAAALRSH